MWGAFGGEAMRWVSGFDSTLIVGQASRLDGCVIRSWSLDLVAERPTTCADGDHPTLGPAGGGKLTEAPAVTVTSDATAYAHTSRWHVGGSLYVRAEIVTVDAPRTVHPAGGKRRRRARVVRVSGGRR